MIVKVSVGEALDKLSILKLKSEKISDPEKLKNIEKEYIFLHDALEENHPKISSSNLYYELYFVNASLWEVEDSLRKHESKEDFGEDFISLARSVYKLNDKRAEIKSNVNKKYLSDFREEKSYQK